MASQYGLYGSVPAGFEICDRDLNALHFIDGMP